MSTGCNRLLNVPDLRASETTWLFTANAAARYVGFRGPEPPVWVTSDTLRPAGVIGTLPCGNAALNDLEFGNKGALFAMITSCIMRAGSPGGAPVSTRHLSVWSVPEAVQLWSATPFDQITFSADGSKLFAWQSSVPSDAPHPVSVFDARTGARLGELLHPPESSLAVLGVTPGEKHVVTRTAHSIYLWDLSTRTLLRRLHLWDAENAQLGADQEALDGDPDARTLLRIARRRLEACPILPQPQ